MADALIISKANGDNLNKLVQGSELKAHNISSILHNSGGSLGRALSNLFANESVLNKIIANSARKASAISYKLSKSGIHLSENIKQMIS